MGSMIPEAIAKRFWPKVNKHGPTPPNCPEFGPCWMWTAGTRRGYGAMWVDGGMEDAHRISWYLKHGIWPEDCVCHRCDTRRCVNPDHFFSGTRADNNLDMWEKGRNHRPQGEANGRSRLTASDVLSIRKSRLARKDLSRAFGVRPDTISQIRHGGRWGHL